MKLIVMSIVAAISGISFYTGRSTVPDLGRLMMEAKGIKAGIELDSKTLDQLSSQKTSLQTEVNRLQEIQRVAQLETSGKPLAYIIKVKLSQSHFTLDIGTHLKDAMNECVIELPVDKDYYDKVQVGQPLASNFRMGSLLIEGSFGSWDVAVIEKHIAGK